MGQITSVAVSREYRRLGLAHKLMRQSQIKMCEVYNCKTCALHVRESNYAARHMYEDVLGFKCISAWGVIDRVADVDVKYYADGENGIRMEQDLVALQKELGIKPSLEDNAASEKTEEKKGKK